MAQPHKVVSLRYYRRHREKLKQKRLQRIANGMCSLCPNPHELDKTMCRPCLNKEGVKVKKVRQKHILTKGEKRAHLIALKGGCCKDCGYNAHPAAFEFDHLRDKKYNISNMLNSTYKWERVLAEVEKCELVCSNCHRIRTHNRRNNIDILD